MCRNCSASAKVKGLWHLRNAGCLWGAGTLWLVATQPVPDLQKVQQGGHINRPDFFLGSLDCHVDEVGLANDADPWPGNDPHNFK